MKIAAVIGLLFVVASPAQGARFSNQFAEFELPAKWQCNLEGAEWVCQNTENNKKRDAIIVLAAKLKGDQDSLDQYLAYLKKAKAYTSISKQAVKSQSKYAKTVPINNHVWVDSLHLESEIPGFYTRYLATVKQDIGVLVTYSVNKSKYQEYLNEFDAMVKTLKVFRKGALNAGISGKKGNIFQNTNIPGRLTEGTIFPGGGMDFLPADGDNSRPQPKKNLPIIPIAVVAALILIFIIRKKRG